MRSIQLQLSRSVALMLCLNLVISCSQTQSTHTSHAQEQVAEYVVEIFEDSEGGLWLGTMAKGAAYYNGDSLRYFTTGDGLGSNTVASFTEDTSGIIWIGTHNGLVKYNSGSFHNYTTLQGLCHDRVSVVTFDKAGTLWIGTWYGVSRYDGTRFETFELPVPEIKLKTYQSTMDWVTDIMEDQHGNIWISRDGYGLLKYNPRTNTFDHYTTEDGLASNNVQSLLEDSAGRIWIGSRVTEGDSPDPDRRAGIGGLTLFDGDVFSGFPGIEGLYNGGVYSIHEDSEGNIWVGSSGTGLYKYDEQTFELYNNTDRMDLTYGMAPQAILEDNKKRLWVGFSGGLFRLTDSTLINITQAGPWD